VLRKFKLRGMTTPFHPHGIALWRDPAGQDVRLFVVNHRTMHDHSIDIFRVDFEQNALTLVQSVVDPDYIHAPNDVWPTGPSSYVYPRIKRGAPPGLTPHRLSAFSLRRQVLRLERPRPRDQPLGAACERHSPTRRVQRSLL